MESRLRVITKENAQSVLQGVCPLLEHTSGMILKGGDLGTSPAVLSLSSLSLTRVGGSSQGEALRAESTSPLCSHRASVGVCTGSSPPVHARGS